MNYIGSKQTLLPFIERVYRRVRDGDERVACDLFAGTGAVGRHFKRMGLRVIANDLQYYAYALNKAYLELNHAPRFERLPRAELRPAPTRVECALTMLGRLPGRRGFIASHYGPEGGRLYYTAENAEKADAIRTAIDQWRARGLITRGEYFYLLATLLEALDEVANTASVYGAYLKRFKERARRPLRLRPLALSNGVRGCRAYQRDANELIGEIECDVLYLDPPYNHRQYGANYHVLETVAAYDDPVLRGVTGMRGYERSRYCRAREAGAALSDLVARARARHILLSYNDEGVLPMSEARAILGRRGRVRTFQTSYQRFKADCSRDYKRDRTVEYVHYVRVVK
jgi:adenine-specific DNA-methyltransferase